MLATLKKAVKNMGVQIPLQGDDFISFRYMPRKVLGSYGNYILNFFREFCPVFCD